MAILINTLSMGIEYHNQVSVFISYRDIFGIRVTSVQLVDGSDITRLEKRKHEVVTPIDTTVFRVILHVLLDHVR